MQIQLQLHVADEITDLSWGFHKNICAMNNQPTETVSTGSSMHSNNTGNSPAQKH